jgi:hypothetical protein
MSKPEDSTNRPAKAGGLVLPVERFRALLREQYTERPALAAEIDSEEWFLKRQRGEPSPPLTAAEAKEFAAAVEALNTFYRRVRNYEERLRGIDEDDVERDIGPIEQATGVDLNIWTHVFDCRSQVFSADGVRHVGHLYRDVSCYADPEPQPSAAQLNGPTVADPAPSASESESAEEQTKRRGGGRTPVVDWAMVGAQVFFLMEENGEFAPNKPGWNAQARLEEAIENFCDAKFGIRPGIISIRTHIRGPLELWRRSKT